MKIEDIEAGEEYAIRYGPSEERASARVLVLSVDPEADRIDERSGGGRTASAWGTTPTGRRIRAVRVRVLKGNYYPFGAYGAEDIEQDAEGLIPPQHVWRTWATHKEINRKGQERRDEYEQARAFAEAKADELTHRTRALGINGRRPIKVPTSFDGELLVDVKVLDELISRAGRLA
jgi:hypothetical protein